MCIRVGWCEPAYFRQELYKTKWGLPNLEGYLVHGSEDYDVGGRRLHLLRKGEGGPIFEAGVGGGSYVQDWPVLNHAEAGRRGLNPEIGARVPALA